MAYYNRNETEKRLTGVRRILAEQNLDAAFIYFVGILALSGGQDRVDVTVQKHSDLLAGSCAVGIHLLGILSCENTTDKLAGNSPVHIILCPGSDVGNVGEGGKVVLLHVLGPGVNKQDLGDLLTGHGTVGIKGGLALAGNDALVLGPPPPPAAERSE